MSEASILKLQTPKDGIITSAFMRLLDDKRYRRQLCRKWLPAETWAAKLTMSGLIDESLYTAVDAAMFNVAMSRSKRLFHGPSIDRFDGSNQSGIFRVVFQKKRYYMVTDPFDQAEYPNPLNKIWKASVVATAADVMSEPSRTMVIARSSSMASLFSAMTFKDKLQTASQGEALSRTSEEDTTSTAGEQHFNEEATASSSNAPESMTTKWCAGGASPPTTCTTSSVHCRQQEEAAARCTWSATGGSTM